MQTYQFVTRAYPKGNFSFEDAMKAAKAFGALRVTVTYPRMWITDAETSKRTNRHRIGYNQPKTVRFQAIDDDHARQILDEYDPNRDIVFVESFAGHYV